MKFFSIASYWRRYPGYVVSNDHFTVLFENTVMVVGHVFEVAYCFNKFTKEEFSIFQFHNDPTCALVGPNNDWCLIGGDMLVLRTWVDYTLRFIGDLKDIHSLKLIDPYTVHILTDPWSQEAAIWELTIDLTKLARPVSLSKIKDFHAYIGQPYTDTILW